MKMLFLLVLTLSLCVPIVSYGDSTCTDTIGHEYLVEDVLRWEGHTSIVTNMSTSDMLTLIYMESTGNPYARRPRSRFHGLLQISNAYMQDALEYAGHPIAPASTLMGDGVHSIQIFDWYMQRYSFLHQWNPKKVAMLHKMGPSGLGRVLARVENGTSLGDAVCDDNLAGACEYYKRFVTVRKYYKHCSVS